MHNVQFLTQCGELFLAPLNSTPPSRKHFVYYSRSPLIRNLVVRIANYPVRVGISGKFVSDSIQITCLEITGYRIKYITVLWLLER